MVNVLIPTRPSDTHAMYVKLALEKKGHQAVLWYTADYPSQQTHSFELKNNELRWRTNVEKLKENAFDVVWLRRPAKPMLPEWVHPEDQDQVIKETEMFYQTLWQVIEPNAIWINPKNTVLAANSKTLQLKVAVKSGFNVPPTLISNDPQAIKSFITQYDQNDVIYKTLFPAQWLKNNELRLTYTGPVMLQDLPGDKTLQITPGIFQQKIAKAYELRITYFGDQYIAAKLHSQDHPKGIMDWRHAASTKQMKIEKVILPDFIDESCKKFMKHFGIKFGCFDFIVTPDNEYYFLEINEQGQFLWIEEANSDIKMLDAFSQFLIHQGEKENNFTSCNVSLSEFDDEVKNMRILAEKLHKNPID